MTRVRVVVLDGLDWKWCNENPEHLPFLTETANGGCSALLKSCEVPVTSDAVAALLAGREFRVPFVNNDRFSTSQDIIQTRPWFNELARSGATVGLCNVPLTWPAFRVPKGSWMVSGFPIPEAAINDARRPWHFPKGFDVVGYPIKQVAMDCGAGGSKDLQMIHEYEEAIVDWFLNKAPRCDVEIIWLRSTDSAGHHYWAEPGYDGTVLHADTVTHALSYGTENLIVVSDHGFDAVDSPRCEAYMASDHGPPTLRAGLKGGHSEEGVLYAIGEDIYQKGVLEDQKLVEVAGGLFDLLGIAPAPGMISNGPQWAKNLTAEDEEAIQKQLQALGYVDGA